MNVIFPGEAIEMETKRIGPGFSQVQDKVIATKCGIVEQINSTIYIENKQKRYLPQLGEPVVGVVVSKNGEFYRVDFGGPFLARLDSCAFEGASRRNKPNLGLGTLIHGRISQSNRDMEPEIECMGISGKAEGFGELKDGHLIVVSLQMARSLLKSDNYILTRFAETGPFEITVGLNGWVFIQCDSVKATLTLANLIQMADDASKDNIPHLVQKAVQKMR